MITAQRHSIQTVSWVHRWTPCLFSFRLTRDPGFGFKPGQFARLGLTVPHHDKPVWRAYSIVSAPDDPFLEFYSVEMASGEFSAPLGQLSVGSEVLVEQVNYGFLTTDRFASGSDLWMLATGTGLAPFMAILRDPKVWHRFETLVLVHGVRNWTDLAYRDALQGWHTTSPYPSARFVYLPVTSRETVPGLPQGRIPGLLQSGSLEALADCQLDPVHSRLMLCGNPGMVTSARAWLVSRGYTTSRRDAPGQLAVENYW